MTVCNYSKLIIDKKATIIETLKMMDEVHHKSLLVFDENKFYSIITIGEIQRSIIANVKQSTRIEEIVNVEHKKYASEKDSLDSIKCEMMKIRAELMPVLNENGDLIKVYLWDDLFKADEKARKSFFNIPVVIMAGGKGSRLAPLTNIYPKPLIPVGNKTIIESIMDKFVSYNCHDFYISVNYKADTIKNYFDFINNQEYNIYYFQEKKPMGTAGSLRLLRDKIDTTFFVSNCDILIDEDYAAILDYHRKNRNELTVVAAMKTLSIPYGSINTSEQGLLESIEEKPTLSFKINTGLYILEPSLLEEIPDDFYHITHLMEKLKSQGRRVGVYPISQNDWKDMGDWDEYLKMIGVR